MMIIVGAGTGLLGEAYAALDHLLGSRLVHAGPDESVERGLVRRRGRNLSAGGEERQMCLDDRVRIVMEQARGPELSSEVMTLRLQLSRQAAIEYDRAELQSTGERSGHRCSLCWADGVPDAVLIIAEIEPVAHQSKIKTGRTVGADGDHPFTDRDQLFPQLVRSIVGGRRSLDLARIASDLGAPLVKNPILASKGVQASEPMPDVGVLGHEPECLTLATTADQDRDRSGWRWIQPAPARADPRQGLAEGRDPSCQGFRTRIRIPA